MSIEKVKEALQKEKNRQLLASGNHMNLLSAQLDEVISRFSTDLNVEVAKEGVLQCIAAAKEACTGDISMAQAEYELTELVTDYEARIAELQAEYKATLANAAALNEELTNSFESYNALQAETEAVKAQLETVTNEYANLQNAAKAASDALRAEVEQLKQQAQTYKAQYEAAIADASLPVNLDNPAPQYDPPAPQNQVEQQAPKNIYEEAAAMLKNMKGRK